MRNDFVNLAIAAGVVWTALVLTAVAWLAVRLWRLAGAARTGLAGRAAAGCSAAADVVGRLNEAGCFDVLFGASRRLAA